MYREMAVEMTDEEVRKCMAILIEGSAVLKIVRYDVQNFIDVTFKVYGDNRKEQYMISLLPDSPEGIPKGIELRIDGTYLYSQYMIAKGYSEYWKGNIFVEECKEDESKTNK